MSKNGGSNNAYTSLTNTNYDFNCSNDAFEEGLDRMD
jgi:secreted Zn-dependent insulinase-like peptidase